MGIDDVRGSGAGQDRSDLGAIVEGVDGDAAEELGQAGLASAVAPNLGSPESSARQRAHAGSPHAFSPRAFSRGSSQRQCLSTYVDIVYLSASDDTQVQVTVC